MKESRTSLYKGYKIRVSASDSNQVQVQVLETRPVPKELFESVVLPCYHSVPENEKDTPGCIERDQIRRAWRSGQYFVDKRLHLHEALRESPDWELTS